MPDGTSERHTPGDVPSAAPSGQRIPRPHRPATPDPSTAPVEPTGYPDMIDDSGERRPGRARRVANWFGFGAPPEDDVAPAPYEQRRSAFGRRDPYESGTDDYAYSGDEADEYDPAYDAPAPASRRRRSGSSHWEDVMLGSSPAGAAGTDTLSEEGRPSPRGTRSAPPPGRRPRPAGEPWEPRSDDDVPPPDPMDPVDPLADQPIPTGKRPGGRPKPVSAARAGRSTETAGPYDNPDGLPTAPTPGFAADEDRAAAGATAPARSAPTDDDLEALPRRMLRMLPPPALADGGGLVVDGGLLGRIHVRAAGVRGGLHQQQGLPRQNCFAVGPDPTNRWTVAIVCDGSDGAYASELAAQIAVRSAYRSVARMVARERHENWDWAGVQNEVGADLRTRLAATTDRAHDLGRPAPAARLAILVTAADAHEDDRVDMAVLGDSTVLRLAHGGWRAPLGIREVSPDSAPAALPDQTGDEQMRICRTTWRPTDVLVMMTGGFAEALGQPAAGLAPRLAEDWRTPPPLLDYLKDVDEGLRPHDDDGCVVALWPAT